MLLADSGLFKLGHSGISEPVLFWNALLVGMLIWAALVSGIYALQVDALWMRVGLCRLGHLLI